MVLPKRVKCVSEKVGEETLVYHRGTAHCLNAEASLIYEHCDGRTTVAEVARQLSLPEETARDYVAMTLKEFAKEKLVKEEVPVAMTRRGFIKRWGAVACALPLITSTVAPAPVAAQSCVASTGCTQNMCGPCTTGATGGGCDDCVCMSFYCTNGDGCQFGDRFLGVGCVSVADVAANAWLNTSCAIASDPGEPEPDLDQICGASADLLAQFELCIGEIGRDVYGCCECVAT